MTHWEPLLPTAQTWSEQASITTFKTQSKNLFFSIIIRTSKEKQFEMLAFIGRVAIKLAVNGGSLRWTFDSDAEQKWSLFRFFEKYYFQLLTTSETELMNIIITKENISIRKKQTFAFSTCIELLLGEKVLAIWKAAVVEEKGERKTCPGENSNEIINQSQRQWRWIKRNYHNKTRTMKRNQLAVALPLKGKWN